MFTTKARMSMALTAAAVLLISCATDSVKEEFFEKMVKSIAQRPETARLTGYAEIKYKDGERVVCGKYELKNMDDETVTNYMMMGRERSGLWEGTKYLRASNDFEGCVRKLRGLVSANSREAEWVVKP